METTINPKSIFQTLVANLDELVLPSKSWALHMSDGKIAILSVKSDPYHKSLVEINKSVLLYENEEQYLQVNTSIFQISIEVPYLNYDIRSISQLQSFVNDFEKVQFCKYLLCVQSENCGTIGKNFSDICANCECAIEMNPECKTIQNNSSERNIFKCNNCSDSFPSLEVMQCHAYVLHDSHLDYTVHSEDMQESADKKSNYLCQICGKKSNSSKTLLDHELTHFIGGFRCLLCQQNFNCIQRIITHTKKYHPNVPFIKCHLCSKKFAEIRHLRIHLRSHTNDHQSFTCSKCNLKFHSQLQLELHEKYHKPNEFDCKKCKKNFSQKEQFTLHNLSEHRKTFYPCRICSRIFEKKLYLLKHEQSHGIQLFECKSCSRRFHDYNLFLEHNNSTLTRYKYICPKCRQQFTTECLAKNHTCRNAEDLKCNVCDKQYTNVHALRVHRRQHTTQKTFECTICDRSFSTKGNLAFHNQRHEREPSSTSADASLTALTSVSEEL